MDREISLQDRRKSLRKQIFKYGGITVGAIIALYFLLGFLRSSANYKDLVISTVDKGPIDFSIGASGKVSPLIEEVIVSPINSRILEVYKNPGEKVEKGEVILKLELASVETEYQQKLDEREIKKSRLEQSEVNSNSRISELKMQEKVKDMQLKQMYTELKNERYLDSIGASTSDKIRQAELNYEVTRLELEQLKEQIVNESKSLEAELKVQQLDLSISDKTLAESRRLLTDARIHSPLDATLTFVNNQIGAQVSAGTQIAIVSDLSRYKVDAEIADSYANYIQAGSRAIVTVGNDKLEGTVLNIVPSSKNGIVNFTVSLKDANHPKLRSGLKIDVYVMIGLKEGATRIKNGSYYMGKNIYNLWVIKGDKAYRREVSLGESNYDYVEVLSGLAPGEEVVISGLEGFGNVNEVKIKK
ncbi:MAG: HlyD family efflux transporter periplasmic adaptor subunit [Candidatus Azobacteroides sp.]|nr:HlyD family efflux transporter periplasmic adaptor subunit [Candidatus Azobacteroides sp.]